MDQIAGFPFFPVEFTKEGSIYQQSQVDALKSYLQQTTDPPVTDLLVMAHGWNNNMQEARDLYQGLLTNVAAQLPVFPLPPDRRFVVMGIFWPSKKFTEKDLIPAGGAAGIAADDQPSLDEMKAQVAQLRETILNAPGQPAPPEAVNGLNEAEKALPDIEDPDKGGAARQKLLNGLRAALQTERAAILSNGDPDAASIFLNEDPSKVWSDLLSVPLPDVDDVEGGGAAAMGMSLDEAQAGIQAASLIGDLTAKVRTGAEIVMNLTTYYLMKGRAGQVGRGGAYHALREIADANPNLHIHLVGHSFGGRLVTSIALGPDGSAPLPLASVTLLQAAFSHNGFSPDFPAPDGGFFKRVLAEGRIRGPLVITYTHNDLAVGYAYPLASRLSREDADALGDANDPYGGIGRNGALHMEHAAVQPTSDQLSAVSVSYTFQPGGVYNLNADSFIKGHSDVTGAQVAHALLSAIAMG